ncbi:MAG: hypothetical protein NTY74_11105 [Ignavibacteriae bacterium]|nr:hypothetical protein [Ignavibacteriota bacterium]
MKIKKMFLIPANICPIVPLTFIKANVPFELIDVNINNICLDEDAVISKIKNNNKYGGLLFNHSYGLNYEPNNFFNEIKTISPSTFIIDDKCLCLPDFDYRNINSKVDLTIFSTGYSKYLDIGFGGFGFLNKNHLYIAQKDNKYNKCDLDILVEKYKTALVKKSSFVYTDSNWLNFEKPQINYLKFVNYLMLKLESIKKHKNIINEIYKKLIIQEIQYDSVFQNWRFNIKLSNKNKILNKIFENNLFASSLYDSLGEGIFSKNHFPNAFEIHSKTINLFNDYHFDEAKAYKISKLINKYNR